MALAVLGAPTCLRAQDTLVARHGDRIRFQTDSTDRWRAGIFSKVRRDTMLVWLCTLCRRQAYPRGRVTALQVSLGRPRYAGRGAIIGALAGAGLVVASVARCRDGGEGPPCALGYVVLPVYAVGGTLVGGLIGSFIHAGPERWRPARTTGGNP